jgi:GH25 family lysozyme M1 (1,4-beta-N-acetylmuramidase)
MRPRLPALLLLVPLLSAGSLLTAALPATTAYAAVTIDGPDVSSYQHPAGVSINWAKVAASGKEFAIVKATEGTTYVNKYFRGDYAGIRNAGMVRGSYHFARPAYPLAKTALAQASFYVSHLGNTATTKTLPPALDLEVDGGLGRTALITWAQNFLLDVRRLTGRTPMIYTYPWFWKVAIGDAPAFARYPLWMAAYHGSTPDAGAMLWQYTAGAKVSGISGPVDMSRLLADPTTFDALADGTLATPWPATAPGAPVAVGAAPGVNTATVRWLPPDAGSTGITGYTATISPADGSAQPRSASVGPTAPSTTFTGLTNGVPYLVTVQARNGVGQGTVAAPSARVVPQFPTRMALSGPTMLNYGATATLRAVLTRADTRAALAGVPVTVSTRPRGTTTWHWLASAQTDATGAVSQPVTPSSNAEVRFAYAGAVGIQPASAVKTLFVRRLLSLSVARSKLYGRGTPLVGGVRVNLQRRTAGHWSIVARTHTGRHGWYAFTGRPVGTYRAVMAATSAYARGISANVTRA